MRRRIRLGIVATRGYPRPSGSLPQGLIDPAPRRLDNNSKPTNHHVRGELARAALSRYIGCEHERLDSHGPTLMGEIAAHNSAVAAPQVTALLAALRRRSIVLFGMMG